MKTFWQYVLSHSFDEHIAGERRRIGRLDDQRDRLFLVTLAHPDTNHHAEGQPDHEDKDDPIGTAQSMLLTHPGTFAVIEPPRADGVMVEFDDRVEIFYALDVVRRGDHMLTLAGKPARVNMAP